MRRRIIRIGIWCSGTLIGLVLLISGCIYFFKDEICGYAVGEVNKYLKTKVSVSDVDLTFWGSFPSLSVDFKKVFIQDAYETAQAKDTLLYSDRIRMKFNPLDIWEENYTVHSIEISPGILNLKVNPRGEVNYAILEERKDTAETNFKLSIASVTFEKMRFSYQNSLTAQMYQSKFNHLQLRGNFDQEQFNLATDADLTIDKISSGKVTLLAKQPASVRFTLHVDKLQDRITLPEATVTIASIPFAISGLYRKDSTFVELHAQRIPLAEFAQKFSVKGTDEIRRYRGSGIAYATVHLQSANQMESPASVKCDFGIKNGKLTDPEIGIRLNHIAMKGCYSAIGAPAHAFLEIQKLTFQTPLGPFAGKLRITHFDKPRYSARAQGNLDLQMVHALFHLPIVDHVKGQIGLSTDFRLNTQYDKQGKADLSVEEANGSLKLEKIQLKLKDDHRLFHHVEGRLYLRGNQSGIDGVSLQVGKTDLLVNGIFENLVSYLRGTGELRADVEISGKNVDLQDLGMTTREEKIREQRRFILPDKIQGTVRTSIGMLSYDQHTFKGLNGQMAINHRSIKFPSINVQNAGADIYGSLVIEENAPELFTIEADLQSANLQFKALLKEWNNFHQAAIGVENITGQAQSKVHFSAPFDLRSGVVSKAIKAAVYLKVTEGKLINVSSLKSITASLQSQTAKLVLGKDNIALLERKLMDLRFETLENTFTIDDGQVTIPQMVIKSSILDVETSGTHTFDNTIDYRFAFKFRDLKDKNSITEFGEELDDGTGMKVFMRMYGNMYHPTVVWDKTSRKKQRKEDIKQEKETVKSMLKSEFGLFKSDTSVKSYREKERPKEKIIVEFGTEVEREVTKPKEEQKPKKESKLKNSLKQWKEDAEKQNKTPIEFE